MLRHHSLKYYFIYTAILFILTACGGSDTENEPGLRRDLPNLQLTSVSVTNGDEEVELSPEFAPSFVGPYAMEVESTVESVVLDISAAGDDSLLTVILNDILEIKPSDGVYSLPLATGLNAYSVLVRSAADTKVFVLYRFTIRRLNSEASAVLTAELPVEPEKQIIADDPVDNVYTLFVEKEEGDHESVNVEEDDGEGNITVSETKRHFYFQECTIVLSATLNSSRSKLRIDGKEINVIGGVGSAFVNIDKLGMNTIDVAVESEDGGKVVDYQVVLERVALLDDDAPGNASLLDMTIEGRELRAFNQASTLIAEDFLCVDGLASFYNAHANNNEESVNITLVPEAPGATITVETVVGLEEVDKLDENGEPVLDDNGDPEKEIVLIKENKESITANEPYALNLDVGTNQYAFTVTSQDGSNTQEYSVLVIRGTTNRVDVSTAEELQAALKNASPNDEIIVSAGTYMGVASEEASGHADAHFYSDKSGTESEPIILRAETSEETILTGDEAGHAAQASLLIAGDYWDIRSVQFSDAGTGLVLDSASFNKITSTEISGIHNLGIQIRNGSAGNVFTDITVENVGVDSVGELVGMERGIFIGSTDTSHNTANVGNSIRNSKIGPNIGGELISVSAGANDTAVEYNIFDSEGIIDAHSVAVLSANNASVAYNTFTHESGEGIASILSVEGSGDGLAGEANAVYQNLFKFADFELTAIASNDVNIVHFGDNKRDNGGELTISGEGIQTDFETPIYQLQAFGDPALCLSMVEDEVDITLQCDGTALPRTYLELEQCENKSSQQWMVEHAEDGYVFIRNQLRPENYVTPLTTQLSLNSNIVLSAFCDENDIAGFLLRWKPFNSDGALSFSTKIADTYFMSVFNSEFESGARVVAFPFISNEANRFIPVKVE